MSIGLTDVERKTLQLKYKYLTDYTAENSDTPIDPLFYKDSNGDTLLHIATRCGDVESIEILLRAGLDVNQLGDMGNTALHYAKSEIIARLLIRKGASLTTYNEFGERPSWGVST